MSIKNKGHWLAVVVIALLITALPVSILAQEEEAPTGFRADAPPYALRGPHPVGVRTYEGGSELRPYTGLIWYPTLNPDGAKEAITYSLGLPESVPPFLNTQEGRAILDAEPNVAGGPYPLVVSSHGLGGTYVINNYLHEQLASHGFVVMAFYHPGSNLLDSMAAQTEEQQDAYWESNIDNLVLRPMDITYMIDHAEALTATASPFAELIDMEHVGVIGYSYGGYTALTVAGGRLDIGSLAEYCASGTYTSMLVTQLCNRHGTDLAEKEADLIALANIDVEPGELWPFIGDSRIDTAVALAPPVGFFGQEGLTAITVPTMIIAGTGDTTVTYEYNAPPAYAALGSAKKILVNLENAGHPFAADCPAAWLDMAWDACVDPVWDMDRAHDLTNHFTTAFLLAELKNDTDARAALLPDAVNFPGITYETTRGE